MRLVSARINSYKCIENSQPFDVDQVTCLLGKNESGKTAMLQALQKLNPIEGEQETFKETEYPRRYVSTYRERQDAEPENVLTTSWTLDNDDRNAVCEVLGVDPFIENTIQITKGYSNTRVWYLKIDESKLVETLVKSAELEPDLHAKASSKNTVQELLSTISEIESPGATGLTQSIKEQFPNGVNGRIKEILAKRLPRFLYFGEYDKLPGRVAIDDLLKRQREGDIYKPDLIFTALLDLANSSPDQIQDIGTSEQLIMELEAISNRLTEEIFEYWSQNRHLDVQFRFDAARPQDPAPYNTGYVFSTRINNRRHRATVNFDERSSGFIWFFSFLVWFSQIKRVYGDNIIILLDEPGLTLHGTAQKDLLRYIKERLKPHYQVLYTTHSPFMLDAENIFSVRTVEDFIKRDSEGNEEILGTKVGQRILSRDRDTLLPLQGIAGFDIAQTMFLGPYVLVVEGPSESGYINWFSRALVADGRDGLDIRWAVCPAESASKVSSFVTLFSGRGLSIAVLVDYHEGQKKRVDELAQSGLLADNHLLRTVDFVDQKDADIEDLVGWELLAHLVNEVLHIPEASKLPSEKPKESEIRCAKFLDAQVRTLPAHLPEYNHYMPVRHLQNLDPSKRSALPGIQPAMERFQLLFDNLNELLP